MLFMYNASRILKITMFLIIWFGVQHPLFCRNVKSKWDLKGEIVELNAGETLYIEGRGRICNGKLVGNNSRIIINSRREWIFDNVELSGSWNGGLCDKVFKYKENSRKHYKIVSNMFRFDTLTFSDRRYYLEQWGTIRMNSGDVLVEGNGVTFVLPSKKGGTVASDWGDWYKAYNLFSSSWRYNTHLTVKDITICDNGGIIRGWGEDVTVDTPVIYFYFSPGQTNLYFENVNSDGCGALLHTYSINHNNGLQIFKNCNIKTSQFAIELGNRQHAHTDKVVIDGCTISRYKNGIFVGPISIVGSPNQVDTVIIKNNIFYEPNVGNVELKGAKYVSFCGNNTTNMFCFTGSVQVPEKYECSGNHIILCSGETGKLMASMRIAGEEIVIKNNLFEIIEKPFPFIEVSNPETVKNMRIYRNTIKYSPKEDYDGFQCLFSLSAPNGSFEFFDNSFKSPYNDPHFCNYFPKMSKRFEDVFGDRINNYK